MISYLLEFITALVATLTWKKYKLTVEKNFIYFFWIVFIIDFLSPFIPSFFNISGYLVHNCLPFVYFIFLLIWYYKILHNKLILKISASLYTLIVTIALIKQDFYKEILSIHFVGGALIIVFCSFVYFKQVLNSTIILSIKQSLPFWITIGNIIFFIGLLPVLLLQKHMNISSITYGIVVTIVNFIAYSCYIIGFIWTKNKSQTY